MNSLNKYLWLSSLVALALIIFSFWANINSLMVGGMSEVSTAIYVKSLAMLSAGYLPNIISFFWLWWAAKQESLSKYAWSFFGLAFGVIALAVFYGACIYYRGREVQNSNS